MDGVPDLRDHNSITLKILAAGNFLTIMNSLQFKYDKL